MRRMRLLIYAWPGLPDLWRRGSWAGLLVALLFTALLNVGLLASFVWAEWLSWPIRYLIWTVLGFTWTVAPLVSRRRTWVQTQAASSSAAQDLFREAQVQYLRGNWFEAEIVIKRLLTQNPQDVEAFLLLATLMRHAGRLEEAAIGLRRLELMEGSQRWGMEIAREWKRLREAASPAVGAVVDQQEEATEGASREGLEPPISQAA